MEQTSIPKALVAMAAEDEAGRHALLIVALMLHHLQPGTNISTLTRAVIASELDISSPSVVDRAFARLKALDPPLIASAKRGRGRAEVSLLWLDDGGQPGPSPMEKLTRRVEKLEKAAREHARLLNAPRTGDLFGEDAS